jgi:insertion element IS1 protein InsB
VTGIHHTTIINWVKGSGEELPEDELGEPELAELDKLQTPTHLECIRHMDLDGY